MRLTAAHHCCVLCEQTVNFALSDEESNCELRVLAIVSTALVNFDAVVAKRNGHSHIHADVGGIQRLLQIRRLD